MEVGPFVRTYRAEIRADFLHEYGRDLRGMRPSEVFDLIRMLPPGARIVRALYPDRAWPQPEVFLSRLEYELHLLLWAQTKDAKHHRNVPEQVLPPGLKETHKAKKFREDIEALPIDELERKLNAKRLPLDG